MAKVSIVIVVETGIIFTAIYYKGEYETDISE